MVCHNRRSPGRSLSPPEARHHCWGCVQGERRACHWSFFLCTLSGVRAPPTRATGADVSHNCHLGLQRRVQTTAAAKGPVSGCKSLLPPSWECALPTSTKGPMTWCQPLPLPPQEYMQPAASTKEPATQGQPLPPSPWGHA